MYWCTAAAEALYATDPAERVTRPAVNSGSFVGVEKQLVSVKGTEAVPGLRYVPPN